MEQFGKVEKAEKSKKPVKPHIIWRFRLFAVNKQS